MLLATISGMAYFVAPPAVRRPSGRTGDVYLTLSEPPRPQLQLLQLHLNRLLGQSRSIPCPFFRRRAGDSIEGAIGMADELARFVAARHKSIDLLPPDFVLLPPPARPKTRGLPLEAVMQAVRADFDDSQYYVTGRLTQAVYSDSCFFDGPDPDMPVRSLQRYSDALKGLFDPKLSSIELLSLEPRGERRFVAHWRLRGALKLPWRPRIPEYTGATLYELDEEGLICCHVEAWSLSAFEAFVSTLLTPLRESLPAGVSNALLPPLLRPTLARIEATAAREHRRALARLERRGGDSDAQPLTARVGL